MKRNSLLILGLLLLLGGHARAQEETSAPDSIIVMGTVVDHLTDEPQPYCLLHFIRETDTAATVRCDDEGYFVTRLLAGLYMLSVTLKGQLAYQSDLVLNDNAALNIAIITDSFSFRLLRPLEVTAARHLLREQGLLIESPNDPHLWDITYCEWCLGGQPAHYGGADAGFKPGRFYAPAKGRKDARIWQIFWPDRVTPVPKDTLADKKENIETTKQQ